MSSGEYERGMYKRWLLDKVLIECWTTDRCAKMIKADPEEVRQDFEKFLREEPAPTEN